jgi:hypothetical protein
VVVRQPDLPTWDFGNLHPARADPSAYAHLIEKGSKRSQSHPFLQPALDSTKDEYLTTLALAIERQISAQLQKP